LADFAVVDGLHDEGPISCRLDHCFLTWTSSKIRRETCSTGTVFFHVLQRRTPLTGIRLIYSTIRTARCCTKRSWRFQSQLRPALTLRFHVLAFEVCQRHGDKRDPDLFSELEVLVLISPPQTQPLYSILHEFGRGAVSGSAARTEWPCNSPAEACGSSVRRWVTLDHLVSLSLFHGMGMASSPRGAS
jgi:hypothetical protein